MILARSLPGHLPLLRREDVWAGRSVTDVRWLKVPKTSAKQIAALACLRREGLGKLDHWLPLPPFYFLLTEFSSE